MTPLKVGIIGQGRIGRCLVRQLCQAGHHVVAVAEPLLDAQRLAYLLRRDSSYGPAPFSIAQTSETALLVAEKPLMFFSNPVVTQQEWDDAGAKIIVDCSNRARIGEKKLGQTIALSQPMVVTQLTPEAKITWIRGANDDQVDLRSAKVISAGTCTGN
jgi:glyceraldehyde 3-phosphate dehydrogenase